MSKSLDELLVERAKRGDVEAFEELVRQYEKKVYNLAYRLTGNADDAWDIAQDAFIRAYSSMREFRGESSFSTWLLRIVHNACLDALRKRSRERVTSLDEKLAIDDDELQRQIAVVDKAAAPEQIVEREELQQAINDSIKSLDEEYRAVVYLRDVEGYSYNEIADMLRINIGTVKSRLNRARHALKQMFSKLELFEGSVVYRGKRGNGS